MPGSAQDVSTVEGMTDLGVITRGHVLAATAECDRLGTEQFLSHYGYGRAREYLLVLNDRDYDSKAIVGVAHRYAAGRALDSDEFSGGRSGAAKLLRDLGFDVSGPDDSGHFGADDDEPWQDVADLDVDDARAAWARAARDSLADVARSYRAVITYKELAALVQDRTRIRTAQLPQHWLGDVLTRVAVECAAREEPNLSSLCVNALGSVGDGYSVGVEKATGVVPEDGDLHAADERLECYRFFKAVRLPEDGGTAALTPRLAASRARARKVAREAVPVNTCPSCFMAIPATGVCDNCG
jgi:hypothetical protein